MWRDLSFGNDFHVALSETNTSRQPTFQTDQINGLESEEYCFSDGDVALSPVGRMIRSDYDRITAFVVSHLPTGRA